MNTACEVGEPGHPQAVMKRLGITYLDATPQSIADQWWFWCCSNVPDELPEYLSELKVKPRNAVGNGLSAEDADKIEAAMGGVK
jgi:hypothetical protein